MPCCGDRAFSASFVRECTAVSYVAGEGVELTVHKETGEPKENIVQNHLNIALLNVYQYLNGRYRHIFIP